MSSGEGKVLEIRRSLSVIQHWWWLLALGAVTGGIVAYLATKILFPQQYQATATVSLAPPPSGPNGLYLTTLAASADAQLVPTILTTSAAVRSLPAPAGTVDPLQLAKDTTSVSSVDGQLLFISVRWKDANLAAPLTNAVANAFIGLEGKRLEDRYALIHRGLVGKENALRSLIRSVRSGGAANDWLQAQYADALSKIVQQDADAATQATLQRASLQMAQPATSADLQKVGPKATINGALGAALGLLVALLVAFLSTTTYDVDQDSSLRPVLTKAVE